MKRILDTIINKDKYDTFDVTESTKLKLKPVKSDNKQLMLIMDDRYDEVDKSSGIWHNYEFFCGLIRKAMEDDENLRIKDIYTVIIQYIVPIAALLLSLVSFLNTRRINALEEKLKSYELERIEKERKASAKTRVEARIVRETEKKYKIHIWNSGQERAYNIDYDIEAENPFIPQKDVTPF